MPDRSRTTSSRDRASTLISLGLWAVLPGPRVSVAGVDMAFDELLLLATEPRAPAVVVLDAARVEGRPMSRLHGARPAPGIVALARAGPAPVYPVTAASEPRRRERRAA